MKLNTSQKIVAYYLGLFAIGAAILLGGPQSEISKPKSNSNSLEGQISMTCVTGCERDATQTSTKNYNFKGNYRLYSTDK